MQHIPRKRFGQHWLVDDSVLDKIIKAADLRKGDRVLEIGPGMGALTKRLLQTQVDLVHAVEIDRDLVPNLKMKFKSDNRFSIVEGNALSESLLTINGVSPNKVVANIPYNITGPLLSRLLGDFGGKKKCSYSLLVLLMQSEVAQRILAQPKDTNFSSMSVKIQLMANSDFVCDVAPSSFKPSPKVNSKVITLSPLPEESRLDLDIEKRIDRLLKIAFLARRKKLRNTIGEFFEETSLGEISERIGISIEQRPQEISPDQWVALASELKSDSIEISKK